MHSDFTKLLENKMSAYPSNRLWVGNTSCAGGEQIIGFLKPDLCFRCLKLESGLSSG